MQAFEMRQIKSLKKRATTLKNCCSLNMCESVATCVAMQNASLLYTEADRQTEPYRNRMTLLLSGNEAVKLTYHGCCGLVALPRE